RYAARHRQEKSQGQHWQDADQQVAVKKRGAEIANRFDPQRGSALEAAGEGTGAIIAAIGLTSAASPYRNIFYTNAPDERRIGFIDPNLEVHSHEFSFENRRRNCAPDARSRRATPRA